ncbi:MAG: PilZ domain-containing protein [Bacillota bacterium]|nr:PilZ domain-containing protein [Bacillota bacterium]
MPKDRRDSVRINTNIHAHIFFEHFIYNGVIKNISCWGARIKCDGKIESHEYIKLNFIFNEQFILHAHIVEQVNVNEYRIKFIFHNLDNKNQLAEYINEYASRKTI